MTITDTITETLRQLHYARALHADFSLQIREAQQRHEAEYDGEIEGKANAAAHVEYLDRQVKALAEAAYAATGDAAPAPGVTVKLFATMEYDHAEAMAWAHRTGLALVPESLDTKAFEEIAKATPLDFVTYGEMPKPTIAADLSKHLLPVGPSA